MAGWVTWVLLIVGGGLGAAVLTVGLAPGGIGRRLMPRQHAFLGTLPRSMRRLWTLTLTTIALELALTIALLGWGPDWWWLAFQLWAVSAPLQALCLLSVAVAVVVASAARSSTRQRDHPPEAPPTARDAASAIGAGSARALRSPTSRALVSRGDRLLRAARAGLDAAMSGERKEDS
jgi:hypothetical protein